MVRTKWPALPVYGAQNRYSGRSDAPGPTACSEAVSYRGLFTADWFGMREKHCSRLEIYNHLRASEQAAD